MASKVSEPLRRQVAERAYQVCEYCLVHEHDTFWGCQVDHIISRKHGGTTEPGNLAWACACCNNARLLVNRLTADRPPSRLRCQTLGAPAPPK